MKKIEAIVRASRFTEVKAALAEKNIQFFTFYEVKGFGHQASTSRSYRGTEYDVGYIGRIKLEIIVSDDFVQSATETIINSARTGEKGDGLVYVTSVDEITNIRTGLKNGESINS